MRYKAIELYIPKGYEYKDSQLYHSEISSVTILNKPHDPAKVYSDVDRDYYPITGTDFYRARVHGDSVISSWFLKIVPETDVMFNIEIFTTVNEELADSLTRDRLINLSWYPYKHFIQDILNLPR
jgi:hypothetical protein